MLYVGGMGVQLQIEARILRTRRLAPAWVGFACEDTHKLVEYTDNLWDTLRHLPYCLLFGSTLLVQTNYDKPTKPC